MRDFKRIDRRNPSMTLNGALLDLYHKDPLGWGGAPGRLRPRRGWRRNTPYLEVNMKKREPPPCRTQKAMAGHSRNSTRS